MENKVYTIDDLFKLKQSLNEMREREFNEEINYLASKIAEKIAAELDKLKLSDILVLPRGEYASEIFNEVVKRNLFPDIVFDIRHIKYSTPKQDVFAKLKDSEWGNSVQYKTNWFINHVK